MSCCRLDSALAAKRSCSMLGPSLARARVAACRMQSNWRAYRWKRMSALQAIGYARGRTDGQALCRKACDDVRSAHWTDGGGLPSDKRHLANLATALYRSLLLTQLLASPASCRSGAGATSGLAGGWGWSRDSARPPPAAPLCRCTTHVSRRTAGPAAAAKADAAKAAAAAAAACGSTAHSLVDTCECPPPRQAAGTDDQAGRGRDGPMLPLPPCGPRPGRRGRVGGRARPPVENEAPARAAQAGTGLVCEGQGEARGGEARRGEGSARVRRTLGSGPSLAAPPATVALPGAGSTSRGCLSASVAGCATCTVSS